jgi:hypothetical protein
VKALTSGASVDEKGEKERPPQKGNVALPVSSTANPLPTLE